MRIEQSRLWTKYDKVQQEEPTEIVSNLDGSLYAVLFNANEGQHSHDVKLVYNSLINEGISDTNISVLEGNGKTQNKFLNKPATIKSLESTIDLIRQKANSNDKLLVYVTNHGGLENRQCKVKSYDGIIWEKDFEQIMQDIPTNFGLFYFAQCHSEGFAERMGYGRNIGIASTHREGVSKSYPNIGERFTYWLFPTILCADKTVESAFDEAVREDAGIFRSEIHQLRWQNADPSKLYLGSNSISKK